MAKKLKRLKPTFGKTWDAHYINAYIPLVAAVRDLLVYARHEAEHGPDGSGNPAAAAAVRDAEWLIKKLGGDRA